MKTGEITIYQTPDGSKRIENNALVALTLMIAESRTEEKDMMVKVVVNLEAVLNFIGIIFITVIKTVFALF